ncbi:MAG: hypothetical protein RL757_1490 [Bacteroidota bacterium]|jgi:hypothetical protein
MKNIKLTFMFLAFFLCNQTFAQARLRAENNSEYGFFTVLIVLLGIFLIIRIIIMGNKGNEDIKNVNKYGGLQKKYSILIGKIMDRNPYYQLEIKNSNNVRLTNTGMAFRLIELDKKLQVTWNWHRFSSGKMYKLQWYFYEYENQDKMYEVLDRDVAIQGFIDSGMTKLQAEEWFKISRSNNEAEQEKLVKEFSRKYPEFWSKITG